MNYVNKLNEWENIDEYKLVKLAKSEADRYCKLIDDGYAVAEWDIAYECYLTGYKDAKNNRNTYEID